MPRTTSPDSRTTKRQAIMAFFSEQPGKKFRTDFLHHQFGTSFRTRVSELNRDADCPITILNHTEGDASNYWAVRKGPSGSGSLFGDLAPDRSYKE